MGFPPWERRDSEQRVKTKYLKRANQKRRADFTVADRAALIQAAFHVLRCAAPPGRGGVGGVSCLLAPWRRDGTVMWRRAIAIDGTFITLCLR